MKEEVGTCTYIHFTYPRTADNNRQGKGMQKLQSNKLVFNRFSVRVWDLVVVSW